jgi:DNA ligase 1
MKPMSGTKADLDKLVYPVYASVKGDGIRVNVYEGLCRTKSLKPLPNIYTRTLLESHPVLEGLEAEITTVSNLADPESFNKATSAFMRHKGEPPIHMWVFDIINEHPFTLRYGRLQRLKLPSFAQVLPQSLLHNREEVNRYVSWALDQGYEGVMLRHHDSLYKFGKATISGGQLLKVKPMEDAEGVLVGFEEGMINTNEKQTNELGRSKRSSAKAGLIPSGMVGTLLVEHAAWNIVRVSGIKDDLALDMFRNFDKYCGLLVTFKYQAHGTLDAPRIAKFKGFRSPDDMTLPEGDDDEQQRIEG